MLKDLSESTGTWREENTRCMKNLGQFIANCEKINSSLERVEALGKEV